MNLSASREIARPANDIAAFFFDASNNPLWQKGQRSCVWISSPPIAVGSIYDQEARFLGRPVLSRFEVVEYDPGRVITIQSIGGSFPIRVRRSVEQLGPDRCRVDAAITGEPRGFFGVATRLLRRLAQRSVDADYDRLKTLLEAR
jgi:hypothetical protein